MQFNVYLSGVPQRDAALKSFPGDRFLEASHSGVGGVAVVFGFGEAQKHLRKPFVHLDHAYFNRGYDKGNFRVSVNAVYQTSLLDVPGDRLEALGAELRPWKRGREVVILEPSYRVSSVLGETRWAQKAELEIRRFTDRPVRIRKKGYGLLEDLKDCHAVVSLASVAEVEAVVYGIPVFATEHSPCSPIAEHDFSRIETPVYPEREPWLKSLSYSQWHVSELGQIRRHLERVLDGNFQCGGTLHRDL
jgi:hypothetical protein